jgi:hypothetical protein
MFHGSSYTLARGGAHRRLRRRKPIRALGYIRLYNVGLHNRSRNRARNWVHFRIWRPRDHFLSTPPTRKTATVPFLRLSFVGRHVLRSPARTDDCGHLLTSPRRVCVASSRGRDADSSRNCKSALGRTRRSPPEPSLAPTQFRYDLGTIPEEALTRAPKFG